MKVLKKFLSGPGFERSENIFGFFVLYILSKLDNTLK